MFFVCVLALGAQSVSEDPLLGSPGACNTDLDYAQVRSVTVQQSGDTWRFSVEVEHHDQGWDHYADRWVVVDPHDGTVYGRRVLAHPHDNEQPFTRSQSGISIPSDRDRVLVVAACNVHGFGGCGRIVELPRD